VRDGIQSKKNNHRVKIAEDEDTKQKYAMKIMKKEDAENKEGFNIDLFVTLMSNEVGKLRDLPKHPNIIELVEFNWDGIQTS